MNSIITWAIFYTSATLAAILIIGFLNDYYESTEAYDRLTHYCLVVMVALILEGLMLPFIRYFH